MGEITNLTPVTMYTITAKLMTHIVDIVTTRFGEEGKASIQAGVQQVVDEQSTELNGQLTENMLFSFDKLFDDGKIETAFLAYSEAQKQAGKEPWTMFAIMAKLFAQIAKAIVERYGKEEGEKAMMDSVGAFGEERGRDIARRAAAVGKPNTMDHYLSNYDMGRSDLFEYETLFHPTEIEQTFTKCAFAEQWKKDGMEDFGILYCHMIDPSIAKGFNPNFEVIHDQYVLKEGVCHFRFQMKEEDETKVEVSR
ncbi:L-2-amino-thiazoline-4-carboxylic acid hydrolase [Sporosarcina sp. ACRSM]|uniref:L-2-amino-thiazoline-4-carboxylic acid hydrolase n=1 Tax=Sporosarcina sp. ACRSM TaxID=2918216 RepID=UPI001EF62B09|nr:L-2-amino-thiazoline-4-carboxylic acid hydrolase [Sporosarcina sp. ACRSM]MCG7335005.1 L-2-amino-thiazoline-4-carboxylic acid hydrolase [Sporosarcina sp. ACRSM]